MFAAVAAFAAASCAQELDNQLPAGETVTFEASVDGAETKAVLEGKVSKWEKGDKITIHNGTKGYEFATTDEGVKANFSYTGDDFSGDKFIAVYPAGNYTADVEAKTVTAVIPKWQQAKPGSYNHDAAVAVAYSENTSLAFKNAVALLKFTVNTDNVTHMYFSGNNSERIIGNVEVTLGNDGVSAVNCTETTENTSVELYAWQGENADQYFIKGTTYYVAVAPQVFAKGVTVEFKINSGEKVVVKTTDQKVETKANTILDLGELEYVAPPVTDGTTLYFKPNKSLATSAKSYAAWSWKTNGDGKWYNMTDADADGVYEVLIPRTNDNIIFAAMNSTTADWNNKTYQTADLKVPADDKNCYLVATDKWVTVDEAKAYVEQTPYKFYVQNNKDWSKLNFYTWGGTYTNGWPGDAMTKSENVEGYGTCKYVEIPYGKTIVNFIINNGSEQTADLDVAKDATKLASGDYIYVLNK